jgi:hypothetical protein
MVNRLDRLMASDSLEIHGRPAARSLDRSRLLRPSCSGRRDGRGWALVQSLDRRTVEFSRCLAERVYHFTD